MQTLSTAFELLQFQEKHRHEVVGLVMTMGSLHEGHHALIKRAKKVSDKVMVSIYVNPLQFGPNEDFDKYPRPLEKDLLLCQTWQVDAVFLPTDEVLYPEGREQAFYVHPPESISQVFHGKKRPQFFNGVATVVLKLLELVRPQVTVFGYKDAQQFCVVSQLIKSFSVPTTLLGVHTIREDNGLAISSRNQYLSKSDMAEAQYLSQLLQTTKQQLLQNKTKPIAAILEEACHQFSNLTKNTPKIELEYLAAVEIPSFEPSQTVTENTFLIGEMMLGNLRLIDSLGLNQEIQFDIIDTFKALAPLEQKALV